MARRVVTILLAASFLTAVPASAAAVPDERAVARHFADTALRAEVEIEAASGQLEAIGEPVTCKVRVPAPARPGP